MTEAPLGGEMSGGRDLENLTRDYGREIFGRIAMGGPFPFGPAWWDERMMEWTMADEAVKVQLFRFIDVLPMLHDPVEIGRHLREYFGEVNGHRSEEHTSELQSHSFI